MPVASLITCASEAEGLIRWSMLFALADEQERLVVFHPAAMAKADLEKHIDVWKNENHPVVPELLFIALDSKPTEKAMLPLLTKNSVTVLVIGQNRAADSDPEIRRLCRDLFDHAPCNVIALRLGSRKVEECDSVLIPSAGGPHSKKALRLGSRVAKRFKGTIFPLFIEPEIGDDVGEAVGLRILDRVIDEAGLNPLDTRHIQKRVVMSNNVLDGVREAAAEKRFDLILIGASNSTTVKRKLFGSVPERLLKGDQAATIAVIRKRRSFKHRIRQRLENFLKFRIPQLSRDERITLFDRLQTQSQWSFDFFALMLLATGIASFGLIQNSPAVVIGAMLVAPLMTPLLGSGLALVQGNLPLLRICLRAIILGFLAALGMGTLIGLAAPLSTLTNELASRGGPNILDFCVAAFSGVAASYCIGRANLSTALAGVAIAAALVPPIATVGISLALAEWKNASGAALLFATNVVAIILASAANFYANGVRGQGMGRGTLWVRRTLICLGIAGAILLVPLTTVIISKDVVGKGELKSVIQRVAAEEKFPLGNAEIESVTRNAKTDSVKIVYRIIADEFPDPEIADRLAAEIKKLKSINQVEVEIVTELRVRSGK